MRQHPDRRLQIDGDTVTRENIWPDANDIGGLVILPGGEVGTVCEWSHADDHSSWRWKVEFQGGS